MYRARHETCGDRTCGDRPCEAGRNLKKIVMLRVEMSNFAWALRGDRTGPVARGDRPLGTLVFLLTPTAGKKGFARFSRA